ncbi:MAG: UDP-GlcNAc--UDP-phosphate GlcNAc-1-phosphate transferase [Bacteroidales bacterium]|nr:UDP-GlcNAc--UDP-phosphate GlcNAc-1-phosphate transferase [Bacteroidales bacterium]
MYYLITVFALLAIEMLYFLLAKKFHVVDRPNERSSHHKAVLLGAGVIFYFAILYHALVHHIPYPRFLIAATLLAVVSYIDDLRQLPSWLRLGVQFGAVILAFYVELSTLQVWQMILLLVVFCGVLNVYNFMDGINGMLAAYSLVVVGTFGYLNIFDTPFVDNSFIATILIGILIFGFFNFRNKARCFSGDVGSIVMGLVVLFLFVRYDGAKPDIGETVSYLCLIIVFLADGLLTIAKRFLNGRNILQAHREHAYETLVNDLKVPHLWVSGGYALAQLLINVGYIMVPDKNLYTFLVAMVLVLAYGLFFFFCNQKGKIHPVT